MKVAIVGTGYVGLTTGVFLAYLGNKVTCIDIDKEKVEKLNNGILPIYEPWLKELFVLCRKDINFTTDYSEALDDIDVIYMAVGTPSNNDGTPNMKYFKEASKKIGINIKPHKDVVVVNKSTVPVGSGDWVVSMIRDVYRNKKGEIDTCKVHVLSNPEFLKEGTALTDAFYPDRIVIGSDDPYAIDIMRRLYEPIISQSFAPPRFLPRPAGMEASPLIVTDLTSAELIKYSANAFLSLKISFINEIACVAEKVGANIEQISKGIGLDKRIGSSFLKAGIGWGGSCFGKDVSALVSTAKEYGIDMEILKAAKKLNYDMREKTIEKIQNKLKIIKGKTIGILGLSFKPDTDDLRDSPAIDIARKLVERGAKIKVYDPTAMGRAKIEITDFEVTYAQNEYELLEGADAVILATDWKEFNDIDWKKAKYKMNRPLIVDGRNFLDKLFLEALGYEILGVGV